MSVAMTGQDVETWWCLRRHTCSGKVFGMCEFILYAEILSFACEDGLCAMQSISQYPRTHPIFYFNCLSGEPSEGEHLLRLRQKDEEHRLVIFPSHAQP